MVTSYSRRYGDYLYDITVHTGPGMAGRFYALLWDIVRLQAGATVPVPTVFRGQYGATGDQAVNKLEAALAAWAQTQSA
jgi:hypothetical protein